MTDIGDVRMYFGTASGSARKALRKIEEPHILLSAQSECAVPWQDIGHLFLDSGGYSLMLQEGEHPPVDVYLDTVVEYEADIFAIQDYPCEPDILNQYGRSVRDHQRQTTVATAECLVRAEERGIEATPLAVIQGWDTQDYIRHIDELREENLLTPHLGIGSVCRRNAVNEIREIITTVNAHTPENTKRHAFGVKNEILSDSRVRAALDSADTTAWYYRNYNHRTEIDETWQEMIMQYIEYRRRLAKLTGVLQKPIEEQKTLDEI